MTATQNTPGGFFCTRCEYNAKGQLTKQYQDTGSNTATTAPTLYEYDSFGNVVKQTLALTDTSHQGQLPRSGDSLQRRIHRDQRVQHITTNTRYNAEGNPLVSMHKSLISYLSNAVERKNITIDERTCGREPDWSFLFRGNMVDSPHAGNIRSHFSGVC